MNNSFAEKMLSMYKIYQPYHVFSFLYLLYDYFLSLIAGLITGDIVNKKLKSIKKV